jgi:hypothetical protein
MRKLTAGLALAAMVAGTAPASAQYGRWHHRHQRDRISTSDALVGAAALVGLIAVLSASKKPKPPIEDAPPPPVESGGYASAAPAAAAGDPGEAAAVDACLNRVGAHFAGGSEIGRVEQIGGVEPTAGGFRVRGTLSIEDAGGATRQSAFRCTADRAGGNASLVIG